eukprot:7630810-Pyramimonas_sp.AAC.2
MSSTWEVGNLRARTTYTSVPIRALYSTAQSCPIGGVYYCTRYWRTPQANAAESSSSDTLRCQHINALERANGLRIELYLSFIKTSFIRSLP